MKKSIKKQTSKAFQIGGVINPSNQNTGIYQVPGTGISGFQQPPAVTTGFTPNQPIQPYFQPTQFTQAQYQDPLEITNIPTFADTLGEGFGQYDEMKTYVNDAGQILRIPFKDGKPLYPIPEGYREQTQAPVDEAPPTTIPLTNTTTTQPDGGGGDGYTVGGVDYGSVANATKANEDMFGATGKSGVNLGAIYGILTGNPIAALSAVSGFQPESFTGFSKEPAVGTGALTPAQLGLAQIGQFGSYTTKQGVVQGPLSQAQIAARLEAMSNLGVTMTGNIGYNKGDAIPGIPGAVMGLNGVGMMKDGTVAKDQFGMPVFESVKDWINYLSLTPEEKEAQRAREVEIGRVRDEYKDAVVGSETTGEAYDGGAESMADAVADGRDPTGTEGAFDDDGVVGMSDEYEGDPMPSAENIADIPDPNTGITGPEADAGAGKGDGLGGMGDYGGYGGDPSEGGADAGRAKGGLIDKQMKHSGLASKK